MIQLAFYRGSGNWFDKIIKIRTNGEHTHCELVFEYGLSWSSSQWDGGTRFKQIDYDPAKWDIVPVHCSYGEARRIRVWCEQHTGLPYDWRGILGLLVGKKDPGKRQLWWCSEGCCRGCQEGGAFLGLDPSMTTPELLWAAAVARQEGIRRDW